MSELTRSEQIRAHLRKQFAATPLSENEAVVDALIEAIQTLEATGDLAALTAANVMVAGAIQRMATQPR